MVKAMLFVPAREKSHREIPLHTAILVPVVGLDHGVWERKPNRNRSRLRRRDISRAARVETSRTELSWRGTPAWPGPQGGSQGATDRHHERAPAADRGELRDGISFSARFGIDHSHSLPRPVAEEETSPA